MHDTYLLLDSALGWVVKKHIILRRTEFSSVHLPLWCFPGAKRLEILIFKASFQFLMFRMKVEWQKLNIFSTFFCSIVASRLREGCGWSMRVIIAILVYYALIISPL